MFVERVSYTFWCACKVSNWSTSEPSFPVYWLWELGWFCSSLCYIVPASISILISAFTYAYVYIHIHSPAHMYGNLSMFICLCICLSVCGRALGGWLLVCVSVPRSAVGGQCLVVVGRRRLHYRGVIRDGSMMGWSLPPPHPPTPKPANG